MNLWEPFQHEFFRDAMWIGSLIAVMCAVLSCFLILRGWSLMGMLFRMRCCPVSCWPIWWGLRCCSGHSLRACCVQWAQDG